MNKQAKRTKLEYKKLLEEAMKLEGKLSDCYSVFHRYSFGNQLLAMLQLEKPEPINTYKGWQALGRQVTKGSKAIELCMPVTIKDTEDEDEMKTIFIFRRNWFGLSQTEGTDNLPIENIPAFDKQRVLKNLNVPEAEFSVVNGNVQGYTDGTSVAINPLAKYPLKTLWHELGHILMGHCQSSVQTETETLPRTLKEVEAESVAYLLSNIFGATEGLEESRGYIQHWRESEDLPEESAKRIIKAVTTILEANK